MCSMARFWTSNAALLLLLIVAAALNGAHTRTDVLAYRALPPVIATFP